MLPGPWCKLITENFRSRPGLSLAYPPILPYGYTYVLSYLCTPSRITTPQPLLPGADRVLIYV